MANTNQPGKSFSETIFITTDVTNTSCKRDAVNQNNYKSLQGKIMVSQYNIQKC